MSCCSGYSDRLRYIDIRERPFVRVVNYHYLICLSPLSNVFICFVLPLYGLVCEQHSVYPFMVFNLLSGITAYLFMLFYLLCIYLL